MKTIYLDGRFLKVNPQIIEAFTPGQLNAKGVFETMLGIDGVVLDLGLHLERLRSGLKTLGIKAPHINGLVLQEVLKQNDLALARVRLMVWQAGKQVHVMIAALSYKAPDKKSYSVCILKTNRPANSKLANVKSLDYELFAKGYSKAKDLGFDEALLLNAKGHLFEASRANIFWVKDNVLFTPPLISGCLNGITRQQVIRKARHLKMPFKEENLTPEILKRSDAAFLTNSLLGIKPIDIASLGFK